MYECDDLELLIRFAVDTVHCLHVFAFNLLIYLYYYAYKCTFMHTFVYVHVCTLCTYIYTCICTYCIRRNIGESNIWRNTTKSHFGGLNIGDFITLYFISACKF